MSQPASVTPPVPPLIAADVRLVARAPRHIPALDGVRGLAILMVMIFHFHIPASDADWADQFLNRAAAAGSNGVNLFFVLSGFLITGILWDAKGSEHYLRNFYARRFLRIFPLYYGALFVGLVLVPWLYPPTDPKYAHTVQQQVWLWTYTSNFYESWSGRALPLFGHFWSLAVEEHFYLVWPLLVLWLGRRALMRVCIVCFAVAFGTRLALLWTGADPALAVLRLTPCQIDCLAAGAFLALMLRTPNCAHPTVFNAEARKVFFATGIVLATLIFPLSGLLRSSFLVLALCNSLWAIFFSAALLLTLRGRPQWSFKRFFEVSALRTLGKYSYGLYVFHWPITRAVLSPMEKWRAEHGDSLLHYPLVFQISYLLLASAAAFLLAWISWHFYEKHFLALKSFFGYGRPRSCAISHAASGSSPQ